MQVRLLVCRWGWMCKAGCGEPGCHWVAWLPKVVMATALCVMLAISVYVTGNNPTYSRGRNKVLASQAMQVYAIIVAAKGEGSHLHRCHKLVVSMMLPRSTATTGREPLFSFSSTSSSLLSLPHQLTLFFSSINSPSIISSSSSSFLLLFLISFLDEKRHIDT